MTLTIVGDITASQNNVQLSGDLIAQPGDLFRLGDEVVAFGGHLALDRQHAVSLSLVSLGRGEEGTTAASHVSGTDLLGAVEAVASGTDTDFPPPFAGGGVFVQSSDPGAVGAGRLWVDTTTPGTSDQHLQRRNATDDGWNDVLESYLATAGIGLTAGGDGSWFTATAANGLTGGGGRFIFTAGQSFDANGNGASLVMKGGESDAGGPVTFQAGDGNTAIAGGDATFRAGNGDAGNDLGAQLYLAPGDGLGTSGAASLQTAGSTGTVGQVLTAQGDTTALWGPYIPPTSDPLVVGALWNNAGTLTISAG